jgi:D-alanyl-D-alanine carboxypeptidase/D-alanyl-D-alanine-endopeptidase (penicillin-binding protein 4)
MRGTGTLLAALVLLVFCTAASSAGPADGGAPAAGPAARAADPTLAKRLGKALRVPHVSKALSAALAVDLRTGRQLFAQNGSLPLAPASNEKLAVTFALLRTFSPALRIATRVEAAGPQEGHTLDGDIVLVGRGDPTLTSAGLRDLALQVRAAGIRHVTGRVLGDESRFDSKRTCPGWKRSFSMTESPPLSALVVDRARFRTYTAERPAKAAALLFRDALRAAGVAVDGGVAVRPAPADATLVATWLSAPLASIIRFMDLHSDNFTAETLLKLLGLTVADRGSTAAGARVVTTVLDEAGISTDGVQIVDGSGLSADDRLTVAALVGMLEAAAADPALEPLLVRSLPVAGVSGTLRYRMRTPKLLGHVVAKTGTTDIASSLSGYVNAHIAFAVVQNGYPLSYWWAREAQDRFASVLASQG